MKKKMIAFVMALLMLVGTLTAAVAAPGDAAIFTEEQMKTLFENSQSMPQNICLFEDNVYALFQTRIYRYTLGTEKPELFVEFFPAEKEGSLWFETIDEAQEMLGEESQKLLHNLFSWEGKLYGFNQLTGKIMEIDTQTGEIKGDQSIDLKWKPADEKTGEDYGSDTRLEGVFNGKLFIMVTIFAENYPIRKLISIDLTSGEKQTYDKNPHILHVFAYKEEKLLALVFDEENAYDEATGTENKAQLMIFDPQTEEMTSFGELEGYTAGGLAYSLKDDAVYYSKNYRIYKLTQGEAPQEAGYTGADYVSREAQAWVTEELMYIVNVDWQGVLINNVDPQYKPTKVLTVYGGGRPVKAIAAFAKRYPNVPIITNDWETENYESAQAIAQAIQGGETQVDIFFVSPGYMDFQNIMKKDYALDLSANQLISENVARFYPYIRQVVTNNEKIYGVPTSIGIYSSLSYHQENWKEAGFTEEDLPKTYMELLDFYKRWQEELQNEHPDFVFSGEPIVKNNLVYRVVEEYISTYQKNGEVVTFDTPVFRNLINKIEELDIPKDWEDYPQDEMEELYQKKSLINFYGDSILSTNTSNIPLLLSIDENIEPAIQGHLTLAFVNPASANQEEAIAYLEETMNAAGGATKTMLYTDQNEPIKSEYYDEYAKGLDKDLADFEAQLEKADEADKRDIQEQIDWIKEAIANKEKQYWDVSQEGLDRYDALIPYIFAGAQNVLYSGEDPDNNVAKLLQDYINGSMSLDQFINEATRRIQMMEMEKQ
ncbi:MAG: carbohydrate ABC transporter substrate-binding protein [Clostridiales bacterium]|nr:carbohydrate ABC transporter substrate-binding protein [Clostridiales bacterium]